MIVILGSSSLGHFAFGRRTMGLRLLDGERGNCFWRLFPGVTLRFGIVLSCVEASLYMLINEPLVV
jgi:hypothetical protein